MRAFAARLLMSAASPFDDGVASQSLERCDFAGKDSHALMSLIGPIRVALVDDRREGRAIAACVCADLSLPVSRSSCAPSAN